MIPKPSDLNRVSPSRWSMLAVAMFFALVTGPQTIIAGEGGTAHVLPGANATLIDLLPTKPGKFIKPFYLHYHGTVSALIPTAVGLAGNVDATVNTVVVGGGYTFEQTVLGGSHYTVAAFLPYSWLDITADVQTPTVTLRQQSNRPKIMRRKRDVSVTVRRHSKVSDFGDLTVVPVMLAWKCGDWQADALVPIYAPTGSYKKGRLGNPGLNYWTFDPMVGLVYSNQKSGFNALLHLGCAINTENPATNYSSGALLHLDGAIQQIIPVGSGFFSLGAEGFFFEQVTGDSGTGANLGDFEGRTSGLGPVLSYIQPLGKQSLVFELKWLTELDTKKRLEGDYSFLKMVYKF